MLLKALYDYASDPKRRLLDRQAFQSRPVHWLLSITMAGDPDSGGLRPITKPASKGKKTMDVIGASRLLPRFAGEKNGGRAFYLSETFHCIFGMWHKLDKRKQWVCPGEQLPYETSDKSALNSVKAHHHFWKRIADATARTGDTRLKALLHFRDKHLGEADGLVKRYEALDWRTGDAGKKSEWYIRTEDGNWRLIGKSLTVAFAVEGVPLIVPPENWVDDSIWTDWAEAYRREMSDKSGTATTDNLCLVTGEVGKPVARSHKPKIEKLTGLKSGGYVVSFAKASPAFSSFGFKQGANAPVSEDAAAAYALGLNDLLADDDAHLSVGGVTFCFWADRQPQAASLMARKLKTAVPKAVAEFLKDPFAGVGRGLAKADRFKSVALSANAGRVVVREWLDVPLESAVENFRQWFLDLDIAPLAETKDADDGKGGPLSLFRLAATTVRVAKELDRASDAITAMYSAAYKGGQAQALRRLLAPVLAEFHSAVVTDSKDKPKYPLNQSRFALLKLILTRAERERRESTPSEAGFMPRSYLVETSDPAYNLGRLLMVLSELQKKAHKGDSGDPKAGLTGAGIVERYYGEASTSPSFAFPVLLKLHLHHIRKLSQNGGTKGELYSAKIGEITARFPPDPARDDGSVQFPRQLDLEAQGRFALGFYQQKAHDRAAAFIRARLRDAKTKLGSDLQAAQALLAQAKEVAARYGYDDLIRIVERANPTT